MADTAPTQPARVLIIGAGYAGAVCAAELAAAAAADDAAAANRGGAGGAPAPAPAPLLSVTLVDPRDHLDSAFTHARALVEPAVAGPALLPLASMSALPPERVRRVRASVASLGEREARLSDGTAAPFDFCVVAAGSSYAFGKSAAATGRRERLAEIGAASELFCPPASGGGGGGLRVLVIGGGPLGVEAAAELLTDAPAVARVTLVHGSGRLMPSLPPRAGALAKAWLESEARGAGRCRLALGRRVRAGDPVLLAADAAMRGAASAARLPAAALEAGLRVVGGVVVAPPGGAAAALEPREGAGGGGGGGGASAQGGADADAVPYDLAIVATGILRNTSFLKGGPFAAALVPGTGAVRVDASLRVAGASNVFAAGDCTDVPEEKLAFLASSHGELVARNVVALAKARRAAAAAAAPAAAPLPPPPPPPPPALGVWRPSMGLAVCIVTLGRGYAIMCVGPVATAGWLPTKLKAANLLGFVNKYRRRLGVKEQEEEEEGGGGRGGGGEGGK
jgi:NADH dehydrogenase FAD-containing subunit